MRRRIGLRHSAGLLTFVATVAAALFIVPAAFAASGAAFTTVNENVDGTGHCHNGNPAVNCNIYDGKDFVWLNGGPASATLPDGTYFFAVLAPGGQGDPNDGTAKNLSDVSPTTNTGAGDAYTNRTFTVSAGVLSYPGTHTFDSNKIRLMPYDDTPNPGGVYIMAICGYDPLTYDPVSNPVAPKTCKYDAFKAPTGAVPCDPNTDPTCNNGGGIAGDPTVSKDAAGAFNTTWTWGISKSVDKTLVRQNGGNVTFTYTVSVTHDAGTNSSVKVTGTIDVKNPNVDASLNTVPVDITDVKDQLSDGTVCTVTGGGAQTLTLTDTLFAYECDLTGSTVPVGLTNTAVVDWPGQVLSNGDALVGNQATFTFFGDPLTGIDFTQTKIDDCVTVTDPNYSGGSPAGTLGTVCQTAASPTKLTYTKSIPVPANQCGFFDNTATFTTDTGKVSTNSNKVTVEVCPTVNGLTIGYWANKNGQAKIASAGPKTGTCGTLSAYLHGFAPFSLGVLATSTCAQIESYDTTVKNAATCGGSSCNAMLKAQMLATALNVFFSVTNGNEQIDLVHGCSMIDSSGGTATCNGTENWSAAFGGATHLTVSAMLTYAASQSNAGGTVWYGQVKATQTLAKDAFDAINNGVALAF